MKYTYIYRCCLILTAVLVLLVPGLAIAGTVGSITGTVTEAASGRPIAGVAVTATSPSGNRSATSDASGFYSINALIPDSYTLSFQLQGYNSASVPGVLVQQDQTARIDQKLGKSLTVIGTVQSTSSNNLVKASNGSDVYNVTGAQQMAVTGGDNTPKTLYEYLGTIPGVTISGAIGPPRIRGGDAHDIGYEFDGIPIRERMFGLFTSNISSVGIGNIEVYTGGLPANDSGTGTGVINSVVKTGQYPAFGNLTFGATYPDHNNYLNFEYGGETPNRKISYYIAEGTIDSSNDFNFGKVTYPNVLLSGSDGPGPVKERDIVGNFHFRPNDRNDYQLLIQNGLGDFNFNYLIGPSQASALSWQPCKGSVFDTSGNAPSRLVGGTAPNGAPCPIGMYFGSIPGFANVWHHYSGIGKIQWNHIINDRAYFALRIAENYNQYIFDQPIADPNMPGLENPGQYGNIDPSCPTYPYQAGTPVQVVKGDISSPCSYDLQSFYGDRSSNMWLAALDYTNNVNAHLTVRLGAGQEYDRNMFSYSLLDAISASPVNVNSNQPLWPNVYAYSDVPTHVPYVYGSATINAGRFVLNPGLFYSRIYYGAPTTLGGSRSVGLYNPTFNGTYKAGPNDVFRFSYGNSSTFVPSVYIYREYPHGCANYDGGCPIADPAKPCCYLVPGPVPNNSYNPAVNGASFNPELNQSADFMWEHQFDPNTSLRVGPWYNNAKGYYQSYAPVKGFTSTGRPIYGPAVKSSNGQHHAFGFEFALNHVDHHDRGMSYWIAATYDNYWTSGISSVTSASGIITPFPAYFANNGIFSRTSNNPLFTGSITADLHSGGFHFIPQAFYQYDTFYNIGYVQPKTGPPQLIPTMIGPGWWLANMTALVEVGAKRQLTLGFRIKNIFDQGYGPTPCYNQRDFSLPKGYGSGCGSANGPTSGFIAPVGYVNQYDTTDGQRIEFFLNTKI